MPIGRNRILTLLTDFGLQDSYVGVMKGMIAQINPQLTVIDLTHQIPPQDVAGARFALMSAYPYFPAETVHVAVVDPGVGSRRRAIALAVGTEVAQPTGFLVGPDNGLFSGVLQQQPVLAAIELTNTDYWRTAEPSSTFHGRDIFAPVAAHLASGVPLSELGTAIATNTLTQLAIPVCSYKQDLNQPATTITGSIQAIDHFGNLITNIPGTDVLGKEWLAIVNGIVLCGKQTYSDRQSGEPVTLVGSHGWVEIAVNQGNAQATLKLTIGNSVQVLIKE
ncbi:SAM hydrolase/SAM-dependent halogenase family protein [Pantanalinema sp. GBBB05]|uniref:SAM hydrolase/SAM-dependent halogenase family protein n=1 Tax=Pantanalinema sp. GBBB05 TaxID=2604139 RepID=UPI001D72513A|nr:SAM-dependent chlorinase/fluorinase [Pantanalinema sp. GBBB05]